MVSPSAAMMRARAALLHTMSATSTVSDAFVDVLLTF
jgi:hypothetical protein